MPFSIDNTTSSTDFVQFGNGVYVSGWLYVAGSTSSPQIAGVDVYIDHSPGGASSPFESGPILSLPPGQYQIVGSLRDPVRALHIRSTIATSPAQFLGVLNEAGAAGIIGGAEVLSTLAPSGALGFLTSTLLTGIIPALGTTPTAGTGFTYTHVNGTGTYVFTFTTPYSAAPVIVATSSELGVNGFIRVEAQALTGFTIQTNNTGGVATDRGFNFLVSAAV